MTTLSTHVLDIERGSPAAGVPVALFQGAHQLATDETNADGRIPHLASVAAGAYRLEFDVAAYFARGGRAAPFLRRVSIEFELGSEAHYHVPLLVSPYACTSYRGS